MDFLRRIFGGAKPKPQPPKPTAAQNEQQAFNRYTQDYRSGKIGKVRYDDLMKALGRTNGGTPIYKAPNQSVLAATNQGARAVPRIVKEGFVQPLRQVSDGLTVRLGGYDNQQKQIAIGQKQQQQQFANILSAYRAGKIGADRARALLKSIERPDLMQSNTEVMKASDPKRFLGGVAETTLNAGGLKLAGFTGKQFFKQAAKQGVKQAAKNQAGKVAANTAINTVQGGINAASNNGDKGDIAQAALLSGLIGTGADLGLGFLGAGVGKIAQDIPGTTQAVKKVLENPRVSALRDTNLQLQKRFDNTTDPVARKLYSKQIANNNAEIRKINQGGYVKLPGGSKDGKSGAKISKPNNKLSSKNILAPKKYKTIHAEGRTVEVEGRPVTIDKDLDTFIHKDENGNWVVSEATTGRSITGGGFPTEKHALDYAKNVVDSVGIKEVKKRINELAPQSTKGATLPRSQRSGLALSTPESQYARTFDVPEEQAAREIRQQATNQTPQEVPQTQNIHSRSNEELLDLGSRPSEPISRSKPTSPIRANQKGSKSKVSSDDYFTTIESEVKGHKTYDINKKVAILDLIRTPDRVLKKIGLGDIADKLKDADRNYRIKLPQEIDKVSKWYDEVGRSPEASQRIFQYLDGQKDIALTPVEVKVAKEMQTYLKEWADRLHLPADKRITNYITHIFDENLVMKEFDPDLEKLIADKVPGSVYDPFTQQRLGAKGYKEDAFAALDAYIKRGTRKEHMDPVLAELADRSQDLDKSGMDYVKNYGDRINMRPTDLDNKIDTQIKQIIGYRFGQRPVAKISRTIRQATYRATLGLNVGSAVRNLTQGINTFTELGSGWTSKGYFDAIRNWNSGELSKVGVLTDSFIEDRALSATKRAGQRLDNVLFAMFENAEKMNRGAAYFGAKAKALSSGASLEEAVRAGVKTAEKTQFTFGRVNTPLALQSDVAKLFTQFQSYNVKQAEFVTDLLKDKEFFKLFRYIGATTVVFAGMSKALGYRPEDMVPFGSNATTGTSPIGGAPVFKIYDGVKDAAKALTNKEGENDRKPKSEKVKDAFGKLGIKIGSATIPGFVQGKKTVGGLKAVNEGKVKIGNKTYPVKQSTSNKIKGAVFGPYALKSKGQESMTKDQMETYKEMEPYQKKQADSYKTKEERDEYIKAVQGDQRRVSQPEAVTKAQDKMEKAKAKLPSGISEESSKVLTMYSRLSNEGKAKFNNNPEKRYTLDVAKVERDLLAGKLTDDEAEAKLSKLYNKLNGITKTKTPKIKVGKVKKSKSSRVRKVKLAKARKLRLGKVSVSTKPYKAKSIKLRYKSPKVKLGFRKAKRIKLA